MALKVFDLQCEHGHIFEGWFASHDDYDVQRERGLVACPLCDSKAIIKRLSAPRLNVSHLYAPESAPAAASSLAANASNSADAAKAASSANKETMMKEAAMAALQSQVIRQVREMVRSSENVGPRFAQEARRIHEGEADNRPIRGTATQEERAELAAEGINVMALPAFLDESQLQ